MQFGEWVQYIDSIRNKMQTSLDGDELKPFDDLLASVEKSYSAAQFLSDGMGEIGQLDVSEVRKNELFINHKAGMQKEIDSIRENLKMLKDFIESHQYKMLLNGASRISPTVIEQDPKWLTSLNRWANYQSIPVVTPQEAKNEEPRSPWVTAGFASFGAGYVAAGIVMGVATGGMALLAVGAVLLGVGLYRGAKSLWEYFTSPSPTAATVAEEVPSQTGSVHQEPAAAIVAEEVPSQTKGVHQEPAAATVAEEAPSQTESVHQEPAVAIVAEEVPSQTKSVHQEPDVAAIPRLLSQSSLEPLSPSPLEPSTPRVEPLYRVPRRRDRVTVLDLLKDEDHELLDGMRINF